MKTQTEKAKLKIIDDVKLEPTLKEAQAFVGGYVEGISMPNGDYLIINEEGKLKGLPFNEEATKICGTGIVGNAVILKGNAKWD